MNRLRDEADADIIINLPDVEIRRYRVRPLPVEFEEDPDIGRIRRPGAGRWGRREPAREVEMVEPEPEL